MIPHLCIIFSILGLAYSGVCPSTFPANNNKLTTAGEFHDVSGALSGQVTPSDISCTTGGSANTYYYGQINLSFSTGSASAGNVCAVTLGGIPTQLLSHGRFVYNAAGNFVTMDGTVISSDGVGDAGSNNKAYYAGV